MRSDELQWTKRLVRLSTTIQGNGLVSQKEFDLLIETWLLTSRLVNERE